MNIEGTNVSLVLGQQIKEANHLYKDIPVDVTFFDKDWRSVTRNMVVNTKASATFSLPFSPVFIATNYDSRLSEAVTRETKILKTTGKHSFNESLLDITINSLPDSVMLFVAHHWAGPADSTKIPGHVFASKERYWTIDGIWPDGFTADATIVYDGRNTPANSVLGHLDNKLINAAEDSLRLLYRARPDANWREYDNYTVNKGPNSNDKFGNISVRNLKKGEYVLSMKNGNPNSIRQDVQPASRFVEVYPNPAKNELNIRISGNKKIQSVSIFDMAGKEVLYSSAVQLHGNSDNNFVINPSSELNELQLNTHKLKNGNYLVKVVSDGEILTKQVVVRK